jgi:hypothetical protein
VDDGQCRQEFGTGYSLKPDTGARRVLRLVTGEARNDTVLDMQAFYDAAFPRIEEALTYCDKFSLHDLPDDARHLLQLMYSLIMVAMYVEIWHQPRVIDGADAALYRVGEPRL